MAGVTTCQGNACMVEKGIKATISITEAALGTWETREAGQWLDVRTLSTEKNGQDLNKVCS